MKLTKEGLKQMIKEELKPTLSKPSKMGLKLKDSFKKELTKSSMKQGLKKKPNIKLSETDDSSAMKRSGYNDLGVGKKDKKKDLDPSFKSLTFESLEYIDESDTLKEEKLPEKGTPAWHELQVAKKTMKTIPAMRDMLGGPGEEHARKILKKYGINPDNLKENIGTMKPIYKNKKTGEYWEKTSKFNAYFGTIILNKLDKPSQTIEVTREKLQNDFIKTDNIKETTSSSSSGSFSAPLQTIKRDINENKKLISKKQLIENTLKENNKMELDEAMTIPPLPKGHGERINKFLKTASKEELIDKYNKLKRLPLARPTVANMSEIPSAPIKYLNRIKQELKDRFSYTISENNDMNNKETIKENNDKESGLLVIGKTQVDNNEIKNLIDREGFTAEWNPEYGSFFFPEKEENYDSLENELSIFFNRNGINARFEGVFNQLDETTTASSSGQYSTPSMWAPNKKGWANKDKKWWGKNSPNTGGVSKDGIVNVKDNCKGYSNSKTQCNSGDISNITITEDVKKIIDKLSKEYNKKPGYIEKLIKEDCRGNYCKKEINEDWQDHLQNVYSDKEEWLEYDKIYNLAKRLGYKNPYRAWYDNPIIQGSTNPKEYKKVIQEQITDKQISEFVKKQLIKEGYLKQTKDNWRGEDCKDYDDSRDICLDKEVNKDQQLNEFKGMRPVYKNKETGEVWELSEIYHNSITLTNLKDITQPTIRVGKEELKNDFIKLGSGSEEIKEDTFASGEIPDDNYYGQIDSDNVMDYIIKYENHELGTDKMIELISFLIKSERIDNMDPEYVEIARRMIINQDLDNEGNILFSKIPVSTPKSADAFSLNEKKIIKITEKELKDILEDKLKENYPPGNNSSYTTPNDVIGELPLYDM